MKTALPIILMFFLPCFGLMAQQVDTSKALTTLSNGSKLMEIRDDENVRMAHYVDVGQYYPLVGVCICVGEINIRRSNGDTLEIPFDSHTNQRYTNLLRVYRVNSDTVDYPILSRKFVMGSGDSLIYLRDPEFIFPQYKRDSSPFGVSDTGDVTIPDSVIFRIEIVDSSNTRVQRLLDEITFKPVEGYFRLLSSCSFRPSQQAIYDNIEARWVPPDTTFLNKQLRLRVTPIYVPQKFGKYTDRSIQARYTWSARHSVIYKTMYNNLMSKRHSLQDSLSKVLRADVDDHIGVYPTVLHRGDRTFSLTGLPKGNLSISVSLINTLGQIVLSHDYEGILASDGRVALNLPLLDAMSGMMYLSLRVNGKLTVKLISFN